MAKGGHLSISLIVDKFSPFIRKKIRLASTAIVGITFTILVILGGRMAYDEYRLRSHPLARDPYVAIHHLAPHPFSGHPVPYVGVLIRVWREKSSQPNNQREGKKKKGGKGKKKKRKKKFLLQTRIQDRRTDRMTRERMGSQVCNAT